jgi:hypothetical protein
LPPACATHFSRSTLPIDKDKTLQTHNQTISP